MTMTQDRRRPSTKFADSVPLGPPQRLLAKVPGGTRSETPPQAGIPRPPLSFRPMQRVRPKVLEHSAPPKRWASTTRCARARGPRTDRIARLLAACLLLASGSWYVPPVSACSDSTDALSRHAEVGGNISLSLPGQPSRPNLSHITCDEFRCPVSLPAGGSSFSLTVGHVVGVCPEK